MTHAEDQVGRGLRAECALLNATVRWPLSATLVATLTTTGWRSS